MSKGIVYILTNPCLDGWTKYVKDGVTLSDLRKQIESQETDDA